MSYRLDNIKKKWLLTTLAASICTVSYSGATSAASKLEEVIVTATKRSQSVRDIPMSINAFTGDQLLQEGLVSLQDILDREPGVSYSGSDITMRGVRSSVQGDPATSAEVSRFLGDIALSAPSTRGGLTDLENYDMATVEILKGPQATLFGGGALAGAIRYVPNQPNFNEIEAGLRVGYGSIEEADDPLKTVSAMLNVPITDTMGVRLVGAIRNTPGTVDDLFRDEKDVDKNDITQGRLLYRWDFIDKWTLSLTAMNGKEEGEFAFTSNEEKYETSSRRIIEPKKGVTKIREGRLERAGEMVDLTMSFSNVKVGEVFTIDAVPVVGIEELPVNAFVDRELSADVESYEFRIASAQPTQSEFSLLSDWRYLVGVYKMDADQFVLANTFFEARSAEGQFILDLLGADGGLGTSINSASNVYASEKAIFLDITRPIFDGKVDVNIGARYAETEIEVTLVDTSAGQESGSESFFQPESRLNPKLALTWNIIEDVSLRASAAQGFRFGGVNTTILRDVLGTPPAFKSDSLWNYEVALRSDWLDNSLRLDVTGYRIVWTDLQLAQYNSIGFAYIDNVGGAQIDGSEASLTYVISDSIKWLPSGLAISVSGSLIDGRTTEAFESEDGTVGVGTQLPLTAKKSYNANLSWNSNFADFETSASINYSLTGDRKNALINSKTMEAYELIGISGRIANLSWPLKPVIGFSVTNLTNEKFVSYALQSTTDDTQFAYLLGKPRTALVYLELSF